MASFVDDPLGYSPHNDTSASTMTIADPLYADWLHQQIRVKPDQLAVHDLSAERSLHLATIK